LSWIKGSIENVFGGQNEKDVASLEIRDSSLKSNCFIIRKKRECARRDLIIL
jgi:hypothetical protein